jgi:hypothetical protein
MLLSPIYKSLPYIYIVAGLFCWWALRTNFSLIFAAALVLAGFIVLWMRRRAKQMSVYRAPEKDDEHIIRFGERRFLVEEREFPIVDSNDNMVAFDRRRGERRKKDDDE